MLRILIFLLLICDVVSANEFESLFKKYGNYGVETYILYYEEGLWIVDGFYSIPGKLPDKTLHMAFEKKENAQKYLKENGAKKDFQNLLLNVLEIKKESKESHVLNDSKESNESHVLNESKGFKKLNELSNPDNTLGFNVLDEQSKLAESYLLSNLDITVETEMANDQVWKTLEEWSDAWELKYAEWIRTYADINFLKNNNIATDCADVAYAYRWIFARINGLPAAVKLPGSQKFFTNESMKKEWSQLKTDREWNKDKRFLKALDYALNMSYTHTLFSESYPIAITKEYFTEGVHHLSLHDQTGHTLLVHRVYPDNENELPLMILQATVPREVRLLVETSYWKFESPVMKEGGFLRFRWPIKKNGVWSLVKAEKMRGYSLEQYTEEFNVEKNFALSVMKRLNPNFNPLLRIEDGKKIIEENILSRIEIVNEGYRICQVEKCQEGSANYENWSTPSRDSRLLMMINETQSFVYKTQKIFPEVLEAWERFLNEREFIIDNKSYILENIIYTWKMNFFSSDPREKPLDRWGLAPGSVVSKAKEQFYSLFNERDEKVKKNTCRNCLLKDEAWMNSNSFEIDNKITRLLIGLEQYCLFSAQEYCGEFLKLLENTELNWKGNKKSIDAWMDKIPFFNSDPRVSDEQRWGDLSHPSFVFKTSGFFKVSDSEVALSQVNEDVHLVDLQAQEVKIVSNAKAFDIEKKSSLALLGHAGNLFLYNQDGIRMSALDGVGEIIEAHWYGEEKIIAKTSSDILYFIALHSNELSVVYSTSSEGIVFEAKNKPIILRLSPQGGSEYFLEIIDWLKSTVVTKVVKVSLAENIFNSLTKFTLNGFTENFYLIHLEADAGMLGVWILKINRLLGEVDYEMDDVSLLMSIDSYRRLAIMNSGEIIRFDENFQKIETVSAVEGYCPGSLEETSYFLCYTDNGMSSVYYINEKGVAKKFIAENDEKPSLIAGRNVFLEKGFNYLIRDFHTHEKIYEGFISPYGQYPFYFDNWFLDQFEQSIDGFTKRLDKVNEVPLTTTLSMNASYGFKNLPIGGSFNLEEFSGLNDDNADREPVFPLDKGLYMPLATRVIWLQ